MIKPCPSKRSKINHLSKPADKFLPTGFSVKVYRAVLSIPFGQVRSYRWVAKKCGSPRAARAVGQVLKRNPYPLIIPCHRVVKSNRQIGVYNLGIRQKKLLLFLEKELAQCLRFKK
jgi:O-6-methylguanine DNA methyltransferase